MIQRLTVKYRQPPDDKCMVNAVPESRPWWQGWHASMLDIRHQRPKQEETSTTITRFDQSAILNNALGDQVIR